MKLQLRLVPLLALPFLLRQPAAATTYMMMPDSALADQASAVVEARIVDASSAPFEGQPTTVALPPGTFAPVKQPSWHVWPLMMVLTTLSAQRFPLVFKRSRRLISHPIPIGARNIQLRLQNGLFSLQIMQPLE